MELEQNFAKILLTSLSSGLWIVVKEFWWLLVLFFIVWLLNEIAPELKTRILRKRKFIGINNLRFDKEKLYQLRRLHPTAFEDYIVSLYQKLGYRAERVGQSHDGGIDVIIEKDGVKQYVQCKKFITSKVSVGAVRDFYGAMTAKLARGNGIFITTNIFTTEAKKFADDNMIEAIDGYKLLELVRLAGDVSIPGALAAFSDVLELCPRCGGKMILRNSHRGSFYGCSNYPKCRFIKNIK